MSHYETCSICGEPFEPVTVCSECDDAITNGQIEEAVKAERERCIQLFFGMVHCHPDSPQLRDAIREALKN